MATVYHDEVELEDFEYDEETEIYTYPCPCGDLFQITKEDLLDGEDVATCPSCSLLLKVIYDYVRCERGVLRIRGFKVGHCCLSSLPSPPEEKKKEARP